MQVAETSIAGVYLVVPAALVDERGHFARQWDDELFRRHGLTTRFPQCNSSFSAAAGTLRGLHYQAPPHGEAKYLRCIRGRLFDVVVDVRAGSPSFGRWMGTELSAASGQWIYVPEGVAHGFLTLEDNTEVLYPVSTPYEPSSERGIRWNDPAFGIQWPIEPTRMSDKDARWPDFRPEQHD
jgi:dTDP-4-dehydrorhamnose 3,5-epimerase